MLDWTVSKIHVAAPGIAQIKLAGGNGALPGYGAGAHVKVQVPDIGAWEYSLVSLNVAADTNDGGTTYTLGVSPEK